MMLRICGNKITYLSRDFFKKYVRKFFFKFSRNFDNSKITLVTLQSEIFYVIYVLCIYVQ